MAQNSKEIRRRIKSVKNIGQITKAMELVSAAKMRKAQTQTLASRPYATLSSELLKNLLDKSILDRHPLLKRLGEDGQQPKISNSALVILITSDRSLAGALNSNVINYALNTAKEEGFSEVEFIAIGKKGIDYLKRVNKNIIAIFTGKDRNLKLADAKPVAKIAVDGFLDYKYDKVFLIYTDFVSTLIQKPKMIQILPLAEEGEGEELKNYEYEPDTDEVLEKLIYRYIDFAVFQGLQEAAASEHSARMVAMRNANQAASDLIDDLTLSANQARQAGITRELSEISAAKLAMEG